MLLRTLRCPLLSPRCSNRGESRLGRVARERAVHRRDRDQGEKTMGEPKVQTTLVPSGVVAVAPLQIDDSHLEMRHDVHGVRGSVAFR